MRSQIVKTNKLYKLYKLNAYIVTGGFSSFFTTLIYLIILVIQERCLGVQEGSLGEDVFCVCLWLCLMYVVAAICVEEFYQGFNEYIFKGDKLTVKTFYGKEFVIDANDILFAEVEENYELYKLTYTTAVIIYKKNYKDRKFSLHKEIRGIPFPYKDIFPFYKIVHSNFDAVVRWINNNNIKVVDYYKKETEISKYFFREINATENELENELENEFTNENLLEFGMRSKPFHLLKNYFKPVIVGFGTIIVGTFVGIKCDIADFFIVLLLSVLPIGLLVLMLKQEIQVKSDCIYIKKGFIKKKYTFKDLTEIEFENNIKSRSGITGNQLHFYAKKRYYWFDSSDFNDFEGFMKQFRKCLRLVPKKEIVDRSTNSFFKWLIILIIIQIIFFVLLVCFQ